MYEFISTPSHGYLRVPEPDYRASGYKASAYSYKSAGYVFLEEDCDAGGFIRAAGIDQSQIRESYLDYELDNITEEKNRLSGAGYVSPYATKQEGEES